MNIENLKFPIGEFTAPEIISAQDIKNWVSDIESLPAQLTEVIAKLSSQQLDKPYRPGGWTGKQVVHHIADSHINAFIRFKLTLTEDKPTIKPYEQDKWVALSDVTNAPISLSVDLIKNLHARLTILLKSLTQDVWKENIYTLNIIILYP
jgi:hypothetical protein